MMSYKRSPQQGKDETYVKIIELHFQTLALDANRVQHKRIEVYIQQSMCWTTKGQLINIPERKMNKIIHSFFLH